MMRGTIAVEVRGLTKMFGDFIAVDGIDLTIKKGEIFGFLGPNGAGKSTTIKMLCGLLLPAGGKGLVGGYDIMKESEEIKNNIGYIFSVTADDCFRRVHKIMNSGTFTQKFRV